MTELHSKLKPSFTSMKRLTIISQVCHYFMDANDSFNPWKNEPVKHYRDSYEII